ncbi:MAG: nucleotidyltransferase family protein, partial [Candidatus Omnitrophica bacterium]|nr:nucleotidyltransferase family protein [Candidatus Omnitrophota bacterium]MBI3083863.1 nucleotidyltransferase family protein [Candidatus Omnitrophota bacterium]
MPTRSDVLRRLQGHQQAMRRFGVRRLGLFGSTVRGESRPGSDLDFLVELERNSFDAYMDLKFFLEELFQCRVDLVLADTLKPRLREGILKEAEYVPGL